MGRRLPEPARLDHRRMRRRRAARAHHRQSFDQRRRRAGHHAHRFDRDHGLVLPVPEPRDRHREDGRRRPVVRRRRRWRELQRCRLRAVGGHASRGRAPFVTPADPCGPNPGTAEQQATAVGGALRAQAPRIGGTSWYDGSIIRVGPDPGAPAPVVVAYGLRNPFRFNFRPGTSELWLGDVGYNKWEEIDRFTPGASPGPNFGWPCYEGSGPLSDYQNLGTDACASIGSPTAPYYTYQHGANPDLSHCSPPSVGGNAVMGGTFYAGAEWPSANTAVRTCSVTTRAVASGPCALRARRASPTRRTSSRS